MKKLIISDDLALPVDAATQTFLVVGKRGSGKSNTAARIVEQLLKAKIPVVVFDPVDSWYGLKASHDGKGPGHSVYVFGGRHKDLDLEPGAGALIAEFLCEHRAPLVLSCKHLSGIERSRFMVDFAMTLYRKWTGGVLHLVLEEAHELAPQAPPKGEKAEEMLGAFKKLWKLGRSSGIGGTAVTQRPASLSKDITTQSEILVVHRTIGPQDVEAVRQWIKYHHQGEEILPELATLKTGEAFVWGPEFPEDKPIGLRRLQVLPRETFDSASTPKAGELRAEPKDLAPVDLERLKSKMAATLERKKAEDPRELQRRVRDLLGQVAQLQAAKPAAAPAPAKGPRVVERLVVKEAHIKRLHELARRCEVAADRAFTAAGNLVAESREIKDAIAFAKALGDKATIPPGGVNERVTAAAGAGRISEGASRGPAALPGRERRPAPVVNRTPRADGALSGVEQRILDALAELQVLGVDRPDRIQVAFLAGYTNLTSKGFVNGSSSLRTAGFIDYPNSATARLTDEGAKLANFPDAPRSSKEIQDRVVHLLGGVAAKVLEPLIKAYPDSMERTDVAAAAGYTNLTSKGFVNVMSRLRSLGFVDYPTTGTAVAKPVLFIGKD